MNMDLDYKVHKMRQSERRQKAHKTEMLNKHTAPNTTKPNTPLAPAGMITLLTAVVALILGR